MTHNRLAAVASALLAVTLLQPLAAAPGAAAHTDGGRPTTARDATASEAVWIDRDTVAWNGVAGAASTQLLYSRDGSLSTGGSSPTGDGTHRIRLVRTTLTEAQKARFPHLKGYAAWSVDRRDRGRVREAL
ncbi:hypothetical protein AB0E62_30000, partial [Streptomyces sp. NPDC038707]|uniref:hypothetical protein n=1 Tax=Streptomyces sp. NPDC038707 TaxID=3154329 RepID=UPI0033D55EA2